MQYIVAYITVMYYCLSNFSSEV